MRYLNELEIKSALNRGKSVEQFLRKKRIDNFDAIEWIEIRSKKHNFQLIYHLVFDEFDEDIESVYDFSYVEPDDIYGKIVFENDNIDKVFEFADKKYDSNLSNYFTEGFLNQLLK